MKITIPPLKVKSDPVRTWNEIKKEAKELIVFLDARQFYGHWKDAFSISHVQVFNMGADPLARPKRFFVVHRDLAWMFGKNRVLINANILSGENKRRSREGCMGFPQENVTKVKRFSNIKVEFWVISGFFKKLKRIEMDLDGRAALIVQHEVQHFEGGNIYEKVI